MSRRILIVGGVAAGASAAAKARRMDESAEIIMFERGEYVSFANCGLPYYISRHIADREQLLVVTPEMFRTRYRIDVRLQHEVVGIDREKKTVSVHDIAGNKTIEEQYDALILTPGAKPIIPPIPMIDAPNVFPLRTIPDMDRVDAWLKEHNPRRATVIGAGYIGLEMAEALVERGLTVTVVEKVPQVLPPIDPDMAALVEQHMRETGVEVRLGDGVKAFEGDKYVSKVLLDSGTVVNTDMVLLSIGVRPDVKLATDAGLALGPTGAIAVSGTMQTSDPHIWAAGDAVESVNGANGKPCWIPLAGPANKQGRIAGANAVGGSLSMGPVFGTSIVRFNKMTAAVTGLNERFCQLQEYDYGVTLIHANQHAGYYPGADLLAVKIIFERKTGKLLGAQVVGNEGVDKRIDVFATALAANMTAEDLTKLDLAYAPPFGSARDPVIVAGFAAQKQVSGQMKPISSDELHQIIEDGTEVEIIDVRTKEEYDEMHLPNAKLIPLDELRGRLDEIDHSKPVVVYCRIGLRGYLACRICVQNGIKTRNLAGGIRGWRFELIGRQYAKVVGSTGDVSKA